MCPARFAASQTVRGRAAACSTVMRYVDSEGKPSDPPPQEVSVLAGATLLDVDRLGIVEKARRLCSRGLLLSPQTTGPFHPEIEFLIPWPGFGSAAKFTMVTGWSTSFP